jgi:hypothetical protein
MGQPIRGGTAFSQVLLDESALHRLMKSLPTIGDEEEEDGEEGEEYVPTDQDIMNALAEVNVPPLCRDTKLKTSMVLPPATVLRADEEDIGLIELDE